MCEVLDESKLEVREKSGILQKLTSPFSRKDQPFTAEMAWLESTYGADTYKSIDKRILEKQSFIRNTIRSKFAPAPQENVTKYHSYHCVVDIEEDLQKYTDEVFKPFLEAGFDVVNLSKECNAINEEGVYFISWKNIFRKQLDN